MAVSTDPWVSVQLPYEHKRYLEIRAGLDGCSRSEILRRIITADADKRANRTVRDLAREGA